VEKPKGPRRWALAMLKAGAGNIGINCGILCASLIFFCEQNFMCICNKLLALAA
jgi:hypothetical protein